VLKQAGKGTMMDEWRREGIAGVYKGFSSEVVRGVLYNAVGDRKASARTLASENSATRH
jgi:hypothetical protein